MIQAKNITVEIDQKILVNNVSMNLDPGKFSVILGKNGAGKSTFFKTISGDMKPTSGEVLVEGHSLDSIAPLHLARKRAVMMQNLHLSFSFTALEVVLMGRAPHSHGFESSQDRDIAMECMRKAAVDHLANRSFPTLSGGEKQRVQFARMLAQLWNRIEEKQPCCLLLDEPLAGLDLAHQHSVMHLVRNLSRKNVAVMMIIHDLNLAAQYADEVNVMKNGRTFALGTPNDVFKPEIIEMAFDCPVDIMRHPHHHCPLVIASSDRTTFKVKNAV
ncbi:MAG: heme ABC transporter ATP-binding protein [Balneolaceae bacterium]